jgi:hypothetical protein
MKSQILNYEPSMTVFGFVLAAEQDSSPAEEIT